MVNDESDNLLQQLTEIPFLGDLMGTLVFGAPFLALGLANAAFGHPLNPYVSGISDGTWMIITGIVSAIWIAVLQAIAEVRLVLPVFKIPWLWLTPVLVILGILNLFGVISL